MKKIQTILSLTSTLLCRVVELLGGGSVAVAVGGCVAVVVAVAVGFIGFGATICTC